MPWASQTSPVVDTRLMRSGPLFEWNAIEPLSDTAVNDPLPVIKLMGAV